MPLYALLLADLIHLHSSLNNLFSFLDFLRFRSLFFVISPLGSIIWQYLLTDDLEHFNSLAIVFIDFPSFLSFIMFSPNLDIVFPVYLDIVELLISFTSSSLDSCLRNSLIRSDLIRTPTFIFIYF